MNPLRIQRGPDLFDELFALRVELFFRPNADGTESLNGEVVWHTEWWHFHAGGRMATTRGPVLRYPLADLLPREFGGLDAPEIVAALKAAFVELASEHLGTTEDEE